jgi:hypothetical protein
MHYIYGLQELEITLRVRARTWHWFIVTYPITNLKQMIQSSSRTATTEILFMLDGELE